jgi:hypothetical protein
VPRPPMGGIPCQDIPACFLLELPTTSAAVSLAVSFGQLPKRGGPKRAFPIGARIGAKLVPGTQLYNCPDPPSVNYATVYPAPIIWVPPFALSHGCMGAAYLIVALLRIVRKCSP